MVGMRCRMGFLVNNIIGLKIWGLGDDIWVLISWVCWEREIGQLNWYGRSTAVWGPVDRALREKPTAFLRRQNLDPRSTGGLGPVDRSPVFSPKLGFLLPLFFWSLFLGASLMGCFMGFLRWLLALFGWVCWFGVLSYKVRDIFWWLIGGLSLSIW